MARNYKPKTRRPGAPDGNANALKHGAYSQIERAEQLRAHSAWRSAKALEAAMKLEAQQGKQSLEDEDRTADEDGARRFRELISPYRDQPNLKGVLADIVRNRMGQWWMAAFDEAAPDYVYAWVDALPNVNMSPAWNEGDDLLPGVPDGSLREGEGEGSEKNLKTTTPPIHPNSLWRWLSIPVDLSQITTADPKLVDTILEHGPFPSRVHAEAYLRWKLRQFSEHGAGGYEDMGAAARKEQQGEGDSA